MHISLGRNKQREEHISRFEDALTSSFFGTLRYLPSKVAVELFATVLGDKADDLQYYKHEDVSMKIDFWPNLAESGRVEPDLNIEFRHPDGRFLNLLIECKWKSGLSSKTQLLDQWRALSSDKQEHSYHLYLVKDYLHGNVARSNSLNMDETSCLLWQSRLLVVTWGNLCAAIEKSSSKSIGLSDPISQWQFDMTAMFERIKIKEKEFDGFQQFVDLVEPVPEVIFGQFFRGFNSLSKININPSSTVVFLD